MSILRWFQALIKPKSTNADRRRREFILNVLLASSTLLSIAALLIVATRYIGLGSHYAGEPPVFAILQVILFAGLWTLSRKGFFVLAAYLLVTLLFLLAFYALSTWGILLSQGVLLLALVLVMASILLGTAVSAAVNVLAAITLIVLSWLQQAGKVSFDASWMKSPGGPADAIGFALTFGVITTVSWLSNREIERFNSTLQERIRSATKRLSTANRNLKVLDKTKDDFISMASHQLGTPLTAITGYLSMAVDEDKGNMTVAQREYINYALEASERMSSMSSDLLNVSRLNSGRFMIQQQPTDLNRLVKQEVQQLQPAADRKNLNLEYTPNPSLPLVNLDESKTRQVVMNFIDNAIYYTAKGDIHVELRQRRGRAVFTVVDTGIGVPEAERGKLFTKFYRADNAKSVRPDGTGLGLYLAKRVIEDQDGTIIFESKEGKGSTFGFSLPL